VELIRQDLYDLYKSKRYLIEVMSDAYIDRYLPRSYSRETAEALVPCARNFLSAVGLWR
jgi:HEPN domain-containing protein